MDDEMYPLAGSGRKKSAIVAFRPRVLYCTTYVWSTLTVGKFTAPLMQQLSPRFTDGVLGMTFALQYAIVASLAGWGGSLADAYERRSSSWGQGRSKVIAFGLGLGTLAFLGHGLPECTGDAFLSKHGAMALWWHIAMRCVYAVGMAISMPSLDGLTLAHLDCIDGASSVDFGKERMYGAVFWGVGSLTAGVGIDLFGFGFLYAFLVISLLLSYASIGVYLWGLSRDTTGAFISHEDTEKMLANRSSERQHEDTRHSDDESGILSNRELLWMVFRTGYGQSFLLFVFALSAGISVVDNLSFIFFDSLGASSTTDGWTVVMTVAFEIPVFYLAPMMLARWGPGRLLIAAGVAYIIRVVGYTFVPDGRIGMCIILMLETLHGLTYAGQKTGSVEFIARIIPEGQEAAGQGILIFISYFGIVGGLALAGWIQETLGARVMFRVMATIVALGMIVLLLAECFHNEESKDGTRKEGNTASESEDSHLIKSESCASSASAFADQSTERYIRTLKYDSLSQKYVKDW